MIFLFCTAGGLTSTTLIRDTMALPYRDTMVALIRDAEAAVIETPWRCHIETPIRGKFFSPETRFLTGISFALEC